MTMLNLELNESLKWMVNFAPTLKQLFGSDVFLAISDREKVIHMINSKDISAKADFDSHLDYNSPMSKVMRTKKAEIFEIPEGVYGEAMKITAAPIFDENNQLVGSITVTISLKNKSHLMQVAEQFASSSEEISASTTELATSANDFNKYMNNLAEAQSNMSEQVENTTKILEMINSVAKNTRILGFNAGIEAARSGEYGRGFSVVAKEITKLADQSADSVNEIRNLLDQLKVKVEQVQSIVKQSVDIANNQSNAIDEISQTIQHLAEVAEDIEELAQKI